MTEEVEIMIRPYDSKTDDAFIYSTLIQKEWYSKNPGRKLDPKFAEESIKSIQSHLTHSLVKICCLKEDPDLILGYSIDHEPIPFFYVKRSYRNCGIEELLRIPKENP